MSIQQKQRGQSNTFWKEQQIFNYETVFTHKNIATTSMGTVAMVYSDFMESPACCSDSIQLTLLDPLGSVQYL